MLFNELPGNRYSNFYNARFFNKTFNEMNVELRLLQPATGEIRFLGRNGAYSRTESGRTKADGISAGVMFWPGARPRLSSVLIATEELIQTVKKPVYLVLTLTEERIDLPACASGCGVTDVAASHRPYGLPLQASGGKAGVLSGLPRVNRIAAKCKFQNHVTEHTNESD